MRGRPPAPPGGHWHPQRQRARGGGTLGLSPGRARRTTVAPFARRSHCGLRIADCGMKLTIRNPQSPIRNYIVPAMRAAFLLFFLTSAAAQAQEASPYVAFNWWGSPFVEHLITAGRIVDPSPLSRPFHVDALVPT